MKGWVKEKIGSYAKVIPGYAFNSSDFKEAGIPVVKIANVRNGQVDFSDSSTQYVDSSFLRTLDPKYQVKMGDVLVSLTGSHITQPNSVVGRIGRLRSEQIALVNQRAAKFEPCFEVCEKGFLYYLLSTETLRMEIALLAHGAANQANVSHKDIEKIKIFWAPFSIQRKIAAVLSAYDDLIENNNHRIAILEKMAEELYHEWFVRLRFPGHEKTKIIKGIPEGWELLTVEKTFEFLGGGTPSTSVASYWQGGAIDWYSPTDLTASEAIFSFGSKQKITEEGLKGSSARLFPAYSIMLTSRATIGEISINTASATTNQGFITCIPNQKVTLCYLFYWLKLNKAYFVQLSNGATFLELTKGRFKKINILVPAQFILKQFESQIQPIFNVIEKLILTNDKLKLSRDKLLSRLMSGKIDLGNLDIQFPASMQEGE